MGLDPYHELGLATATLIVGLVAVAVALAVVNRRSIPRDGRAVLSTLGKVSCSARRAASACTSSRSRRHRPTRGCGDLITLAAPPVVAVAATVLPIQLRRPAILLALATVLSTVYTGRANTWLPDSIVLLVLLLVLAVLGRPVRAQPVALAAAATVLLIAWVSGLSGQGPWPRYPTGPMSYVAPAVAALVMLGALWWGIFAAVQTERSWAGGMIAVTVGLFWLGLQAQLTTDPALFTGFVAAALAIVIAIRFAQRRLRRTLRN